MSSPDKLSLHDLYSCNCPDCGGRVPIRLSISETESDELQKAFNKVTRWIFREKKTTIDAGDIEKKVVQPLLNGINTVLQEGVQKGIAHQVPSAMKRHLSENVYIFSGAKTYIQLKELSGLLLDNDGHIKPFSKFFQDAQTMNLLHNQWLEAEYIFATQSAQMAAKWQEYKNDGDRYNLQYRTANDDKVREEHAVLHDITLAPSDPFWTYYFPPNGWRCRCTAVQVRKNKYPESDSNWAQQRGVEATEGRDHIFRFNPGKQEIIFPDHHPYLKSLSDLEHKTLKKIANDAYDITSADDVVKLINEISEDKDWFERGFKSLEVSRNRSQNGATDLNGRILLDKERLQNTISGINSLTQGEEITFTEADALSTFWHEITHNRSKPGNMRLTHLQDRRMELANEFVARNTLDEFFSAFGSNIPFPELVTNRVSTGYNQMVRNYQKIVELSGLNKETVVDTVKQHLFNETLDKQTEGLVKALKGIKKADGSALKKAEIDSLVRYCDRLGETSFEKYLKIVIH